MPTPTHYLEIWRSSTGMLDADFSLVSILSESTVPGAWTFLDDPLTASHNYYYKARRQEIASGCYSDWSDIVLVQTLASGDQPMGYTPTGASTLLGIGLQPADGSSVFNNFGGACKVTDLVEYRRGSIRTNRPALFSEALKDTPSGRHKSVTGDFSGAGDYECDLTPAGATTKLLTAIFGPPTTTGSAAPYTHVWKNTWTYRLATFAQLIGSTINVYPDSLVHDLKLSASRGNGGILGATFGVMAGNRIIAATQTAVALDTAGYDAGLPWSVAKGTVQFDAVDQLDFDDLSIDFAMDAKDKKCWTGKLGPNDWVRNGSTTGVSLTGYFASEDHLERFFGQAPGPTKPYGFTDSILEMAVGIEFTQDVGGDAYSIQFEFPKCAITAADEPVQGRDAIMQPLSIEPRYSTPDGTDMIITVVNGQANAGIVAYGAALTIPTNAVY